MRGLVCSRQAPEARSLKVDPSHLQVQHVDRVSTSTLGPLAVVQAASAADLDLAMPVIGLFGAGAPGTARAVRGVMEAAGA